MLRSRRFFVLCLAGLFLVMWSGAMVLVGYHWQIASLSTFLPESAAAAIRDRLQSVTTSQIPLATFDAVFKKITVDYLHRPTDDKKLFYGAIAGAVSALDDPYSVFLNPESAKQFGEAIDGTFEGIGAELGIKDDMLTLIAPLPGSPAAQAGLLSGDKILAIDGEDASSLALDEAVLKIRGPKGSTVTLTIVRSQESNASDIHDIQVKRDTIIVPSVTYELLDGKIAHLLLFHFSPQTPLEFTKIENQLLVDQPQGIILDLRNNPGGYLNAAVAIASSFLKPGTVVVSEDFGDGTQQPYLAQGTARLAGIPTVVLIDQGTASAAEILAGALIDQDVAQSVGATTFGKGTVQQYDEFADGSALKLTVARWLTPKGTAIDKQGITPQFQVAISSEDIQAQRDPQLDQAKALLTTTE